MRHPVRGTFACVVALAAAAIFPPSAGSSNDAPVQVQPMGAYDKFENAWLIGFTHELKSLVPLRIQHTSNGGLNNTNPSLDMLGINLALDISN